MFKPKPIQQQLQPCRVKEEDAAKCSLHQGFDNNACSTEPLSRSSTTLQGLVQFEESVDIIPLQINIRSPDDIWYQVRRSHSAIKNNFSLSLDIEHLTHIVLHPTLPAETRLQEVPPRKERNTEAFSASPSPFP